MIAQALKHDGPAVVEVYVARQERATPPSITLEQAVRLSVFMVKAVLSGRATKSSISPRPTCSGRRPFPKKRYPDDYKTDYRCYSIRRNERMANPGVPDRMGARPLLLLSQSSHGRPQP